MDESMSATARRCLSGSYDGTLDFPSIVRALAEAGFESYSVDFRRGAVIYYLPSGESLELAAPKAAAAVAPEFDAGRVERAVREAQAQAPGYTYRGFCETVKAAGCAGYMVSFLGRRVLYFGRSAEVHVEHFPS